MQIMSASETERLLPYIALAHYLSEMLRDKKAGKVQAPTRTTMTLAGGGVLLLMPASDETTAITKLVTVHPANNTKGLPTVQADVLVMDAATGGRLLLLEGSIVTARRTAALSLLAAMMLAPEPAGPLLVVGAGVQATAHVDAMIEGLGTKEVDVASRDQAKAEALAKRATGLGARSQVVANPAEVLDHVTVIVTATSSATPVLPESVRDDAFIAAVGAFRPDMAELPAALVRRASLYVDTVEGAQAAAGDIIQAGVDWGNVTSLEDGLDVSKPVAGPFIFKSVGYALWDLAAARLALREAGA